MDEDQTIIQPVPDVPEAAAPEALPNTVVSTPESQMMPPITRPEDIMTTVEPAPTTPDPVVPEPVMPTYAPQPAAAAGNAPEMWSEPATPAPSPMPEVSAPDPAMVPDPMFSGSAPATDSYAAPAAEMTPAGPEPVETVSPAGLSRNKMIIYCLSGLVGVVIISIGGFFGFQLYAKANNAHILTTAVTNFANMKGASNSVTIGADSVSFSGKLDIDNSQNSRFTANIAGMNADAIYIKNKDVLYLGDMISTGSAKNYTEFDSVKKGLDSISTTTMNISNTNRLMNDFVADDMKSVTRDPDESVAGAQLIKYTITPTKNLRDKLLADLNTGSGSQAVKTTSGGMTVDVWIDSASQRITRLKGEASVTTTIPSSGAVNGDTSSSGKFTFEDNIKYDYKDTVKLPIGAKVSIKMNLADIFKSSLVTGDSSASSSTDSADVKMKANVHEVQNALEQYFVDNEAYPTAEQGLIILFTGGSPYLSEKSAIDGLSYTVSGETYELSFVLNDQKATDSLNIKTVSGKKVYFVTSKQGDSQTSVVPLSQ